MSSRVLRWVGISSVVILRNISMHQGVLPLGLDPDPLDPINLHVSHALRDLPKNPCQNHSELEGGRLAKADGLIILSRPLLAFSCVVLGSSLRHTFLLVTRSATWVSHILISGGGVCLFM